MHNPEFTPHVSLCSGYEGIGRGLRRAIPNLRTVAYCEREAYAVANLVCKIEAGLLDDAPVFTSVETFPYAEFYPLMGATDSICSFGFPCQPHSLAGKRSGASDERWLFDTIADGLVLMRPKQLFIENVPGLLSSRMPSGQLCIDYIFCRLAGIGYQMADHKGKPLLGIFSASEVGAPHERKRVFIMGESTSSRLRGRKDTGANRGNAGEIGRRGEEFKRAGSELAHSPRLREREPDDTQRTVAWKRTRENAGGGSEQLADASRAGSQGGERAGAHDEPGTPAHGPARERRRLWPSRPGEPQYDWEYPRIISTFSPSTFSRLGGILDGFESWMDTSLKGEYATTKERADKALHLLQLFINSEAFSEAQSIGAAECFQSPDVLRSELPRNGSENKDTIAKHASPICTPTSKGQVRGMPGNDQFTRSPQGSESSEQLTGELADALWEMPCQRALDRWNTPAQTALSDLWSAIRENGLLRETCTAVQKIWRSASEETKARLAVGLGESLSKRIGDNRVDRLRLCGNGVIPATAELAYRTLSARLK